MKTIAHERLKFIDESGVTTVLTRLFGRAAPGIRVREAAGEELRAINFGGEFDRISRSGNDDVDRRGGRYACL